MRNQNLEYLHSANNLTKLFIFAVVTIYFQQHLSSIHFCICSAHGNDRIEKKNWSTVNIKQTRTEKEQVVENHIITNNRNRRSVTVTEQPVLTITWEQRILERTDRYLYKLLNHSVENPTVQSSPAYWRFKWNVLLCLLLVTCLFLLIYCPVFIPDYMIRKKLITS